MAAPTLDTLARFAATGLLNSLVLGTAIAAAAWAFVKLSGKQDSSVRFGVWFSALLLGAILPWIGAPAFTSASGSGHSASVGITLPGWWALAIFWLWAAGASLALLRVGFAFSQLLRLRWRSRPLGAGAMSSHAGPHAPSTSSEQACVGASERSSPATLDFAAGGFRDVEICVSDEVRIPTAVGLFQPLVVLPSWALEELSPEELNSVLIHELEHLRRWDDWTNLAQKILAAVFFFHPAVWWLDRKLALEREIACDQAVLAQTGDRHGYAACLVRVAERSLLRRGLALAQSVVGRVGQTTLRVTEILRASSQPRRTVWKPALCLLSASSLCGVLLLTQTPLISFQAELPTVAAITPSATAMMPTTSAHALPKAHPVFVREPANHAVIRGRRAPQPKAVVASDALQAATAPLVLSGDTVQSAASTNWSAVRGFVVVVETEQDGPFGPSFWTICVWHLDAPGWPPVIPQTRTPAKTI